MSTTAWLSRARKRFVRTIEIKVSQNEFTYRHKDRERRVPTRGYLRKGGGRDWGFKFEEKRETMEHVPIDLSSAVPLEFRPDIGKVLAAFREAGAEIAADGEVHFQTHATSPATLRLAEPD